MKKLMTMIGLLVVSVSVSACGNEIKGRVMFSDVEAHTLDEMHDFALYALQEKYGIEFELDTENDVYGHKNGHDDMPIELVGSAYPKGNKEDMCRYEIVEPNTFYDNYSSNKYKTQINEYLQAQMDEYGVQGRAEAKRKPSADIFEGELDIPKYLSNGLVTVYYEMDVPEDVTDEEIMAGIRPWMDLCYTRHFDWYFRVYQGEDIVFTLSDSDHGHKSSGEWSDEEILETIHNTRLRKPRG